MTGIFKRTHTEETISTWEEFKNYLKMGKAKEFFGDNASLEVQVEGLGAAILDILDYDKERLVNPDKEHSATLAVRDLVFGPMPFSKKGENKWETSDIRKYINSEEFINRFEPEFRNLLCKVYKNNKWEKDTLDMFFLPSVEEVKGEYAFFKNEKKRVKITPEQEKDWYWTRSAYRGLAYGAWCVSPSGHIISGHASWTCRICPVCVIAV